MFNINVQQKKILQNQFSTKKFDKKKPLGQLPKSFELKRTLQNINNNKKLSGSIRFPPLDCFILLRNSFSYNICCSDTNCSFNSFVSIIVLVWFWTITHYYVHLHRKYRKNFSNATWEF